MLKLRQIRDAKGAAVREQSTEKGHLRTMTEEEKLKMFENRLIKVYRHLGKQARRQEISCWRLYDRDLPEFPLIIDIYETHIYIAEYRAKHTLSEEQYTAWLDGSIAVVSRVTGISLENVFVKERRRKTDRQDQYLKTGEELEFFSVHEGGLLFKINLSDYLDTGLFLDHRVTRDMVRKNATGKKLLNLFCYTGSFSVYAAAGGAASVVSVDLSKTYLAWALDNFVLNDFNDEGKFSFVHADVLQYLDTLEPESFDLVVLDPPTFSNSKRMKDFLDIQLDHVSLINNCLRVMKPGGTLYFSTNYTKFKLETEKIQASSITDITRATTPFDFEGKLQRACFEITR